MMVLASSEKSSSEMGWPSSSRYEVNLRAWNAGPSATQMLRLPSWLKVHATRLEFLRASRFSGKGALSNASSETGFCAAAPGAMHANARASTIDLFIIISGRLLPAANFRNAILQQLIRGPARDQPFDGHARKVQRPGNPKHVALLRKAAVALLAHQGLYGQV